MIYLFSSSRTYETGDIPQKWERILEAGKTVVKLTIKPRRIRLVGLDESEFGLKFCLCTL